MIYGVVNYNLEPVVNVEEEGKVVVLSIEDAAPQANGKESVLEMFERLRNSVPPDTWDGLPVDGAKNIDHYLYGARKEEE